MMRVPMRRSTDAFLEYSIKHISNTRGEVYDATGAGVTGGANAYHYAAYLTYEAA